MIVKNKSTVKGFREEILEERVKQKENISGEIGNAEQIQKLF